MDPNSSGDDEQIIDIDSDDDWSQESSDHENPMAKNYMVAARMQVFPDHLTRFEFTKLIGYRAQQIAQNSRVFVTTTSTDVMAIAFEELLQNKSPILIRRTMPDQSVHIIRPFSNGERDSKIHAVLVTHRASKDS